MAGIARVLSKWGHCSRTEAVVWVEARRVVLNGVLVTDPELPVDPDRDEVYVDGHRVGPVPPLTIMLNKPRGLVTTTRDEHGRDTIYSCLKDGALPWLAPVGRLDRASEGLLLLTNDPRFAAAITDPTTGPAKRYHVQIGERPKGDLLGRLEQGVEDSGELLRAVSVIVLREGSRTAWLEIALAGGRNRQIRRMLAGCGHSVRRLVRVAIGALELGDLVKGRWRVLGPADAAALGVVAGVQADSGRGVSAAEDS